MRTKHPNAYAPDRATHVARMEAAARLCPTCGSEPAPCHTSCGRCLDAALARKAARKSAVGFVADDLCVTY